MKVLHKKIGPLIRGDAPIQVGPFKQPPDLGIPPAIKRRPADTLCVGAPHDVWRLATDAMLLLLLLLLPFTGHTRETCMYIRCGSCAQHFVKE